MLHQSTLAFLYDLKRNNDREWFAQNRPRYETAKTDIMELGAEILEGIRSFDPSQGNVDIRKAMFRIARDTRFSPNKAPYKSNMGMSITRDGIAHSIYSCYYIHIEPENCLLATGIYMPQPAVLKAIRRFIDDEWEEFNEIISAPDFVSTFGGLNREGKILKRIPTGFAADSPAANYLRLADFHVTHPLSDQDICGVQCVEHACEILQKSQPLHAFLNRAIEDM